MCGSKMRLGWISGLLDVGKCMVELILGVLFRCLGGIHPFSFPKQYPARQRVAPKEPIPDKIEPLISPSPASSALLDKRYRPDSQSIKSEPQSIDSEEARDRWEYERAMSEDGNYSDYRCRIGETMAQKQNRRATRNLIERFKASVCMGLLTIVNHCRCLGATFCMGQSQQ